jgi:hypothetical protein
MVGTVGSNSATPIVIKLRTTEIHVDVDSKQNHKLIMFTKSTIFFFKSTCLIDMNS